MKEYYADIHVYEGIESVLKKLHAVKMMTGIVTSKSEAIYIGDTVYDMKCAGDAGNRLRSCSMGAPSPDNIDAKYILNEPKEILELL